MPKRWEGFKKKRPYDNTKRALNAAPKSGTSNKEHALDPSRWQALRKKGTCKCFLSNVGFRFIGLSVVSFFLYLVCFCVTHLGARKVL